MLGLGVGIVLLFSGFVISSLLIGLSLTTTAVGTLLPMLRDRRHDRVSRSASSWWPPERRESSGPVVAVTVLLGAASPATEPCC